MPLQIVPEGIESINGSSITMGCATPLKTFGGVMYCGVLGSHGDEGYLVDGHSPAIDTSSPDWASQLVTVRKTGAVVGVSSGYVIFTFDFTAALSLTSIELDLFLCPEWGIGTSFIGVFADNNTDPVLASTSTGITNHTFLPITSCDSLSTVLIPLKDIVGRLSYDTWHLVMVYSTQSALEWAHVGEVRFQDQSSSVPLSSEELYNPVRVPISLRSTHRHVLPI